MDGSPCDVTHGYTETCLGLRGLLTSQTMKPEKFPWKTYLPLNAMSELMNVNPLALSNSAGFFENDNNFIPFAASPASYIPDFNPLRGSGPVGYVCACSRELADTAHATASTAIRDALITRVIP